MPGRGGRDSPFLITGCARAFQESDSRHNSRVMGQSLPLLPPARVHAASYLRKSTDESISRWFFSLGPLTRAPSYRYRCTCTYVERVARGYRESYDHCDVIAIIVRNRTFRGLTTANVCLFNVPTRMELKFLISISHRRCFCIYILLVPSNSLASELIT